MNMTPTVPHVIRPGGVGTFPDGRVSTWADSVNHFLIHDLQESLIEGRYVDIFCYPRQCFIIIAHFSSQVIAHETLMSGDVESILAVIASFVTTSGLSSPTNGHCRKRDTTFSSTESNMCFISWPLINRRKFLSAKLPNASAGAGADAGVNTDTVRVQMIRTFCLFPFHRRTLLSIT